MGILEKFDGNDSRNGYDHELRHEFVADNNASNRAYLNVNGQSQEFTYEYGHDQIAGINW